MDAPPDATEEKDYLKREFLERLDKGSIEYTLQIKVYETENETSIQHDLYNGSSDWPGLDHPWRDLMKITLTSHLPSDVTNVTHFNIANHPMQVLGLPTPQSQYDFNVVPHMMAKVYSSSLRQKKPKVFKGEITEYKVTVVTGKKKGAGTDADVFISLIGKF